MQLFWGFYHLHYFISCKDLENSEKSLYAWKKAKNPILYCRDLQAPQAALLWKEARLFENHCMGSDTLLNTIVSEHGLFLHPWKQSKTPAGKDKTFRKSWPLCPLYRGDGVGEVSGSSYTAPGFVMRGYAGCITAHGIPSHNLNICSSTIYSEWYIHDLAQHMLPTDDLLQWKPCLFHQDNAKLHSSKQQHGSAVKESRF